MNKNYTISLEVFKFPLYGNFETNDNEMFSEKFCCYAKKVIKGIKWAIFYVEVSFTLANGVIPSQAIGLPIFSTTAPITKSMNFNDNLSAKPKIAPFIINRSDKIIYQEIAAEEVDSIISRFLRGEIDKDEFDLIFQLQGGDGLTDIAAIIGFVILVNWLNSLSGVESFQVQPLPHMDPFDWLQGSSNHPKTGSSGYNQSPTSLEITRPSTMPHQDFVTLSKEERRQLPNSIEF